MEEIKTIPQQKQNSKTDHMQAIALQLSKLEKDLEPTHAFDSVLETNVKMRDGINLMTRVYFPTGTGPWPVVLERSPYPQLKQAIEMTSKQFTKYGYVVVSQECRGKGDSEGEWVPFENERNDGIDTLQWIIKQRWMDGNVAMYGHSYGGFEQWIVADQLPKEVKTLFLGVFGTERYRQMYMNGMFRHEIYTAWATENSGVKTKEKLGEVYQQALKIKPHIDMDIRLFNQRFPWYREWVTNVSKDSEFWQTGIWKKLSTIPKEIKIPVYLVGGWYDHHLDGSVCGYKQLPENVKACSRFVIGPWIHTLQPGGDLDYPNSDFISLKEAIKWFNHQLKGERYEQTKGVVETYVIRDNTWKTWKGWVKSESDQKVYLNQNKLEIMDAFVLSDTNPSLASTLSFQYDPTKPVKTKGGEALLAWISEGFNGCPPSSVEQDSTGDRADVLSFVSETAKEDLRISGTIKVHLSVSTDVEDTSFTVKISEVFQDGKSYNIRDGITSIVYRNGANEPQPYEPGEVVDLVIELWPITWTVKKGSKLRLDVSSSNFPAYHIHPNTKGNWAIEETTVVANQKIHLGKGAKSYLEIPVDKK